jgi:hypothetical protein
MRVMISELSKFADAFSNLASGKAANKLTLQHSCRELARSSVTFCVNLQAINGDL